MQWSAKSSNLVCWAARSVEQHYFIFVRLLIQLDETSSNFETFWTNHKRRLEQCLQLRHFEEQFKQVSHQSALPLINGDFYERSTGSKFLNHQTQTLCRIFQHVFSNCSGKHWVISLVDMFFTQYYHKVLRTNDNYSGFVLLYESQTKATSLRMYLENISSDNVFDCLSWL